MLWLMRAIFFSFNSSHAKALKRVTSDHSPLFISANKNQIKGRRIFRFLVTGDFSKMVSEYWFSFGNQAFLSKLKFLKNGLPDWKSVCVGNLEATSENLAQNIFHLQKLKEIRRLDQEESKSLDLACQ